MKVPVRQATEVIFGRCRVSGTWGVGDYEQTESDIVGAENFGKAVYQMLKQMNGIGILAVYAPAGDKLYEYSEIFHEDVRVSGTLRSFSMPQDADLIIAAHSHDFISPKVGTGCGLVRSAITLHCCRCTGEGTRSSGLSE